MRLSVSLLMSLLVPSVATNVQGRSSAGTTVPAECQLQMDAWCNSASDQSCLNAIHLKGWKLPLYARNDTDAKQDPNEWRCYSPSSLSNDLSTYTNGTAYCSRGAQLEAVLDECLHPDPHVITVNTTLVFTEEAAAACGQIRTPELVRTPNAVLLFGQCRSAPGAGAPDAPLVQVDVAVGDDFRHCRMVMLRSDDGGKTWGSLQYLTARGTGVGVAIYDTTTKMVVLQYQELPNVDPYHNNTLWQMTSADEGANWSLARDLTSMLSACNGGSGGMVCGGAGTRLQTSSGRLVFSGHNNGFICVWYSDDHGQSYQTSTLFAGDENSIAQLADGSLYMNGRGMRSPWSSHRTSYRSTDEGNTWSAGEQCPLTDVSCDVGMVADSAGTLFLSEPHGPGRTSLRISCSTDGGVTWPNWITVNVGDVAAYSALQLIGDEMLLAVWEQQPNMVSHLFDTKWC